MMRGLGEGPTFEPRNDSLFRMQGIDPCDLCEVGHVFQASHEEAAHAIVQGDDRQALLECRSYEVSILPHLEFFPFISRESGQPIRQGSKLLQFATDDFLASKHLAAPPLKRLIVCRVMGPFVVQFRCHKDAMADGQDCLKGPEGLWGRWPIRGATSAGHIRIDDEHPGVYLLHVGSDSGGSRS